MMSAPKAKRRVGRYELGRTIGEGAFAKVRFAENVETGDHVALKILDKDKVLQHKLVEQVSIIHSSSSIQLLFCNYHRPGS